MFPQRPLLVTAHVEAIDLHRARDRIVKARNQADDRRFARARRADECRDLAGLDPETHVFENRALRVVAESDMIEFDFAL